MKRHRVWLSGLAALAALPAAAKVDEPNDLIHGRWYATEVIIFERTEPTDPGPEELVWKGGRTWPATARAFAEPKPWRIASLDPLTRACLEFPRLVLAPTTTTPAQCAEADPDGREAAQPWPRAEADPLAAVESLPTDGVSQQPNRGRDALAPGMARGSSVDPWSEGVPPSDGAQRRSSTHVTEGQAPVPCLSTPPPSATTPSGTAPLEPMVFGPPPTIEPSLAPHPLLDLLRAAARQQEALRRDSYRWLPQSTHELGAQARRVRITQGLDIIWHGRWIQPVPSRSAGEPLRLTVQSTPSHGHLSGTLQVTLGRYLHFDARLWLEQGQTRQCPGPSEGRSPGATGRKDIDSCDNLFPASRKQESEAAALPYMRLNQARTMRSGELHYLDHPRMGVLVRIDPLPPSPALVQALQAWRESMLVKAG